MPTINEVIERVERIKPVANVDDQDKARWLIELDGRILREIIQKSVHDTPPDMPPAEWPEDGDKQLLVPSPYDRLYDLYLLAQIEFAIREFGNYNNSMAAFNSLLDIYACHYRNNHMPVSHGDFHSYFP